MVKTAVQTLNDFAYFGSAFIIGGVFTALMSYFFFQVPVTDVVSFVVPFTIGMTVGAVFAAGQVREDEKG